MMALLFVLLLVALMFAWLGYRRLAIAVYAVSLIAGLFWSFHHMSSMIGLAL